ncbi:hypothetical protein B0H19DRAFT_1067930 [Mycena capillaripes]|nr:hypothetical protein B0H19DRAFT_1067930 [Mycena capillaripes]
MWETKLEDTEQGGGNEIATSQRATEVGPRALITQDQATLAPSGRFIPDLVSRRVVGRVFPPLQGRLPASYSESAMKLRERDDDDDDARGNSKYNSGVIGLRVPNVDEWSCGSGRTSLEGRCGKERTMARIAWDTSAPTSRQNEATASFITEFVPYSSKAGDKPGRRFVRGTAQNKLLARKIPLDPGSALLA